MWIPVAFYVDVLLILWGAVNVRFFVWMLGLLRRSCHNSLSLASASAALSSAALSSIGMDDILAPDSTSPLLPPLLPPPSTLSIAAHMSSTASSAANVVSVPKGSTFLSNQALLLCWILYFLFIRRRSVLVYHFLIAVYTVLSNPN